MNTGKTDHMAHNPYNHHLEHCDTCQQNPLAPCAEADRTLHEAVENGSAGSYDRGLEQARSGARSS